MEEEDKRLEYMNRVPVEVQGWNWGAFFFTWIWGITHGVWISLLTLIPFVGWVRYIWK
ncbi:DUF2628 domain-containing protein [Hazenella sp. IB182353]|uniref:DUF2628 domain-containing protein n=1 Tax=Polycladospora coralii TaxID=2771432 RepID=UPI001745F7A2|nr:DUF2628 domain-containing protein [Polycladospora coralii]MBS7532015.1 DUF2628 domain-containing protein [Polycladospora coralii]